MTTILVADEEPSARALLQGELAARGYQVMCVSDGQQVIAALDEHELDLVISDVSIYDAPFMRRSKEIAPLTEVVIATPNEAVANAVECVKSGAFGYVQKPYAINELVATLERALERKQLRSTSALYQTSRVILDTREPHRLPEVIVKVAMQAMNADDVALMLPGHDDKLYVACSTALTDSIREEVQAAIGELVLGRAAMLREPLIESTPSVGSCIVYPLCMNERLVGVLLISRIVNPRPFRKHDVEHASVIASQTLLALENMRLVRHAIAAERFSTVGQVATSIAHEVNNPIAYVLASQRHLRDSLTNVVELCNRIKAGAEAEALRELFQRCGGQAFVNELLQSADDVRDGAERVRDILRDVRALATHDAKPIRFDVNEAIRSALRIVAAELRHKTEIKTELADGLRVVGVPGRLSQVFISLLINAAEAFGNRAGNMLVFTSKRVGGHIVITVTDNGPGIAPEQLPRIFDAFYTTKPLSAGTGMGLPISRDIVRSIGGEISVTSTLGVGTTFSIVLPQAPTVSQPTTVPPPIQQEEAAPDARLRIMFVDDEANILRSYKRAFGKQHDVITANNGKEALDLFEQSADYDLVVCDLSMPTMSGMQLYQIACDKYPVLAAKFVFATGGSTQRELEQFLRSVPNRVLEKPFDMAVLRELIAELQRIA